VERTMFSRSREFLIFLRQSAALGPPFFPFFPLQLRGLLFFSRSGDVQGMSFSHQ